VKLMNAAAAGALLEFEASGQVLSQAAAALQSRALVYVYSCNLGAAIQVYMHASSNSGNPITWRSPLIAWTVVA